MHLNVGHDAVEDGKSKAHSPYKIDVVAQAIVLIIKGAEKLDAPENLATVNGASLIWSAIRDQVLTLTSRMPAGPVMLPTVSFHDLRNESAGGKKQTKLVSKARRNKA